MRYAASYMAGMIDADGNITWRDGKYHAPDVGVTNCSLELMSWIQERLGGSVSLQRATCPLDCSGGPGHIHRRNPVLKWHLTGERAVVLLECILPYMVIKRAKAEQVIEQYYDHLNRMARPARRVYHIQKEREAMAALGWLRPQGIASSTIRP